MQTVNANNIIPNGSPSWSYAYPSITPNTNFNDINGNTIVRIEPEESVLKVNGKIILNDESIDDRLKRIEDMLHIPSRNVIMEEKYDKLNQLWKEYNETLEAIKTWETIKESK